MLLVLLRTESLSALQAKVLQEAMQVSYMRSQSLPMTWSRLVLSSMV